MLFAHCASLGINAQHETWNRGGRQRSADAIARLVELDMVAAGWVPTADNYQPRSQAANSRSGTRGRDERSAQLIDHLKKGEMAKEAERLLAGSGGCPNRCARPVRRTPVGSTRSSRFQTPDGKVELAAFLTGGDADTVEDTDQVHLIAAG